MNRGAFVLGMHRSGTSAATRLLTLLGVATCVESDLLPASPDNPTGFWESASLVAFNDQLLARYDSDWSCPPALAPGWADDPALEPWRHEAARLFSIAFPTRQWIWKDPRNCTTLPFWLSTVSAKPVVVLVYRNPLEVADSLAARDGFDIDFSLALWERCVRSCLTTVTGLRTMLTDFSDVLADPVAWCERARAFLDGSGFETRAPDLDAVGRFVQCRSQRSGAPRVTAAELDNHPAVSPEQRATYAALEGFEGMHDELARPVLPAETPSTELLLAERRRLRSHALEAAASDGSEGTPAQRAPDSDPSPMTLG